MARTRQLSAIVCALALVLIAACRKDPAVAKRDFVRSGDQYVAQKKYAEAIIQYKNAVALDARFSEARTKLADTYMQDGDTENAFSEYSRVADLLPEDVDAQLKVGDLLLLSGHFEEANARADKALAASPTNVNAQILKGNALAGLRDLDGAISQIQDAIKIDPNASAGYASLGALQLARGNRDLAEAAFTKAVAADPKSVLAELALANFYWSTDRRTKAESALTAALALEPQNIMTNRALAAFYLGSNRPLEAEAPLKVVAAAPGIAGRLALADYYASFQRIADAKTVLEQLAVEPEGFAPATVKLASLGEARGDRTEAYRLVNEVLKKSPKNVEALLAKAQLQLSDNKLDDALTAVRAAVTANPGAVQALYLQGRILATRGDAEQAGAAYQEAVRLNPRFAPAYVELGRAALAAGKLDQAIQYERSAMQVVPGYAEAHLLLARAELAKRNPGGAERSLQALNAAFPELPAVQVEVGRLYLLKGDRIGARAAFERALAKDKFQLGALEGLAVIDLQAKRPEAARARIETAMKTAPDNGDLQVLAARTYMALRDDAAAEGAFKRALEVNPNSLAAYGGLGQLYALQKRLPEATAEFEKLAARQPKAVAPLTTVAVLLQMQNKTEEARAKYQQVVEMNSRAAIASNNLAWLYADKGENLDIALQLAQAAKAELPDQAEVNDTLGWVYYKKGLASLALPPLTASIVKDPKNAPYHYHLGLAYAALGDTAKARQSLEQALALSGTFDGADDARKVLASVVRPRG